MADKHVIESDTSVHPVFLNSIVLEGTKIKWHGSFDELKLFVESHLNLKGKWSSPGGSTKQFNSEQVMIKYSKQSSILSLEGEASEKVKQLLAGFAQNLSESEVVGTSGDVEVNESTFEPDILKLHRRIDNIEVDLRGEISKIVAQLIAITNEQNHLEYSRDYASLLMRQNEDLTKYNSKLKQENDELRDRLNTMAYALSDFNKKVEDTENEKLSLVTALKVLQEEQIRDSNDHSRADRWQKNSKANKTRMNKVVKDVINIDLSTNNHVVGSDVITRNRFEPLSREESESKNSSRTPDGQDKCGTNENTSVGRLPSSAARHNSRSPEDGGINRHKVNRSVLVAGDSMLKNLNHHKISKSTNTRVHVKAFPGATVRDMEDHIKPGLRTNPDSVILHIGTNDIRNKEPSEIVNQIADLCEQIKKTNQDSKVTISEIIERDDNHSFKSKVIEVNKLLKTHFNQSEISILSHANIDGKSLNRYGLHLNRSGTSLLAKNLINHIKSF